jgi:hypothetical protein
MFGLLMSLARRQYFNGWVRRGLSEQIPDITVIALTRTPDLSTPAAWITIWENQTATGSGSEPLGQS